LSLDYSKWRLVTRLLGLPPDAKGIIWGKRGGPKNNFGLSLASIRPSVNS
jgi:hypothetical protein